MVQKCNQVNTSSSPHIPSISIFDLTVDFIPKISAYHGMIFKPPVGFLRYILVSQWKILTKLSEGIILDMLWLGDENGWKRYTKYPFTIYQFNGYRYSSEICAEGISQILRFLKKIAWEYDLKHTSKTKCYQLRPLYWSVCEIF